MQSGFRHLLNWSSLVSLLPWITLTGLLFLAPNLDIFPFGFIYDEKRILEITWLSLILLVGIVTPALVTNTSHLVTGLKKSRHWLLILLLFFGGLSVIYAPSPPHALQEYALFLAITMAIFILAATTNLNRNTVFFFIAGIVFFNLYYLAGLTGGLAATIIKGIPVDWPYPVYGFTNIRFFNQYMVPTFPLMVGLPLLMKSRVNSKLIALFICILPVWSFFLFYTGSRGAPLAIIVSGILVALLYRSQAYGYLKLLTFSLIIGYLIFAVFKSSPELFSTQIGKLPDVVERSINAPGSNSKRIELIGIAWDHFQANPILGIGPMHFTWGHTDIPGHPHNSIMQVLSEWGLINSMLLLMLVWAGLTKWFSFSRDAVLVENQQQSSLLIILTAAFLSGGIYSLFSGVTIMPMGQLMMTAITALMTGQYFKEKITVSPATNMILPRIITILAIGGAAIILLHSTLPDLSARATGQVFYLDLSVRNLGPRFWQFGSTP